MMRKITLVTIVVLTVLTGCSSQEISEWNQKISDFGSGVSKTMTGGKQERATKEYSVSVPVDVDTAASRLRRYYGFSDVNAKIAALNQTNRNSDKWVAQAIAEEGRTWEATPGSYYKMGRKLGETEPKDEVLIELEKDGVGSRMYITYHSSFGEHLTENYVNPLFYQMRDVAAGKVR